ncbi:MAG: aminotransferase class I/II-fold pyridoxal phosphate-dependent enzyme, partial [Candidatus Woesearchaeota archaeon]|nr:aminotransferase class I/II-fold pyridoxal phosphate-dependent enzyme [Candidatus Woesearchaeota archaeon]
MTLLSTRAKNCKQSPTLSISATAKALKEQGKEVIDFSAGQPDFEPPSFIKKAVKQAIDEPGIGRYNNVSGSKQCREAIAEKIKSDYNIDYEVDEIIVTNGAKQALFNVFQAMVSKDDEVIIPEPYWASFPDMVSFT